MPPPWLDAVLLACTAVAMTALTWRGWADPLVDFGREAYVAWRLAAGDRLYSDVAWFNGPLSAYVNATGFRLFGPGLTVLYATNGVVLGATTAVVHHLVRVAAGRGAALLAAWVFLSVFAFGQYVGIANYNWIAPYAHELTHGVALALGAVAALAGWRRGGDDRLAALGGLLMGLTLLTKLEPILAGAAGSLFLLASGAREGRVRGVLAWLVALLLPAAISALLLGPDATFRAFTSVTAGDVAQLPFYRGGMGLDDPWLRLEETIAWATVWCVGLGAPLGAAWLARETTTPWALPLSALVAVVVLIVAGDAIPWTESLRPLQFVALAGIVLALAARRPGAGRVPSEGLTSDTGVALGLLSLVLLAKMLLNVRSGHYGFALAAPATAYGIALLYRGLPDLLDAWELRGDVVRGTALAIVLAFTLAHVRVTQGWMERKTEVVGEGRDALRTDVRGAFVQRAVDHVRAAGYGSVAVLPEGVMINYLARVPNSTPFVNFMPPEEILFSEASWVEAFRATPPEAIVIVPKDTSEFGRGSFGFGYGRVLAAWVQEEYEPVAFLRVDGVTYMVRVLSRRNSPT